MREDWTKNSVKAVVKSAFKEVDNMGGLDDFTIDVTVCKPDHVQVVVKRMYEYVPVDFQILSTLSNIFNTQNINVDNYSTSGCETCDWGSSYETTFDITP